MGLDEPRPADGGRWPILARSSISCAASARARAIVYNSATKFFRQRGEGVANEGILGDIVDSQPVYVGQPFANYQEHGYATFKSTRAGREPMLYVGANDGMLHAFYAEPDRRPTAARKPGQ